ncbi:MAG: sulfur carrier protein ThiS adenylyltransferase ThiF, partial [Calditrichia bacterium]|nr:sulfur carrier protein ThiS adenylyltransferase ThiF [Calditrichia bacterium]
MDNKKEIFVRNVPGSTEKLQQATVGISGCGGLGSNSAVAMVRAGIGKLILVDFDIVEESNLNRQFYFQKDIGRVKVEALAEHLKAINPDVELVLYNKKLQQDDIKVVFKEADLLLEAFDRAESKHWLIDAWGESFPNKPIIVASGLSGLGNTSALKVQ